MWARAAWAALGLPAAESKGARYSVEPPFRRSCIGLPGLNGEHVSRARRLRHRSLDFAQFQLVR